MTEQEKRFISSLQKKLIDYDIQEPINYFLSYAKGKFIMSDYHDGTPNEIIDIGVEYTLCKMSPYYFISKYCTLTLPGVGDISAKNLYYYQKCILRTCKKLQKVVLTKTRQCLTEDCFVNTSRGYISIKDVKIGDKIQTIKDGKLIWTDVLDYIPQGKRKVCKITTVEGNIIISTPDHKYLTTNGWKEAKDLTTNDNLVSNTSLDSFGTFELDDDKKAALIGYYLADGKANSPIFTNTDIDYLNECKEAGKLFENCYPDLRKRKNSKNRKEAYDLVFTSKSKSSKTHRPFIEFMKRFGLNQKGDDRVLTEELMNLNKHQMSIMLNRLFAGDGWATYKKDARRPNTTTYEVGLGAPNYRFLKQIEYILKSKYGILCKVQKQNEYLKGFWKLRIQQKDSVKKFINEIGIYKKANKIDNVLLNDNNNYKHNYKTDKVKKIEYLEGEQEVYDITTETHDFLANGVVVHNCGMSTLTSLYFFWKVVFSKAQVGVIISKDKDSAMDVLKKIKSNLVNIPWWADVTVTSNNMTSLGFSNGSEIKSLARNISAGRGKTPTIVLMDEAAFYGTYSIVSGIASSVGPSLGKSHGQFWIVSTPNGSAEGSEGYWYYEQVKALQETDYVKKDKSGKIVERLYDVSWWEIPDTEGSPPYKGYNKKLDEYSKRDYFFKPEVKLEAEKFFLPIVNRWKENDWLRSQHDNVGEVKFRQEILKDFVIVGNSVFNADVMAKIEQKLMVPYSKDVLTKGVVIPGLEVYKDVNPGYKYIVSVDVAKGTAKDSSCIQVIEMHNKEQVAEYLGPCTTYECAQYANRLGRYYNNAFLVVECNSIGEAVFIELYYNLNYPNLYRQKKTGINGRTLFTGWMTTKKTRPLITDAFIDMYYQDDLWSRFFPHSSRLLEQQKFWIWTSRGPDHSSSCKHDDAILALAIGLYNIDEARKHDIGEDQIVFYTEDKNVSAVSQTGENLKYYDTHEVRDRQDFINTEKRIFSSLNIPKNDDSDPMDVYNWLIGN